MKLIMIRMNSGDIYIFPTVKGLTSEKKEVEKYIRKIMPDVVALPISPEDMEGLLKFVSGEEIDISLSHYEIIYAKKLSKYGDVAAPPPSYTSACITCQELGIKIVAIDMNDEEFAEEFCERVDVIQLYRQSIRWRFLKYKSFKADSPEKFVLLWDKEANKLKGYRDVETAREKYMGKKLIELNKKYRKIFAIVDYERCDGVITLLKNQSSTTSK